MGLPPRAHVSVVLSPLLRVGAHLSGPLAGLIPETFTMPLPIPALVFLTVVFGLNWSGHAGERTRGAPLSDLATPSARRRVDWV
jgi:hypothetical protein